MSDDLKFNHPFMCTISGPSGSAKSSFCVRFLEKKKQPPPLPSRHFDVGTQTEHVAILSTSAAYETRKPRFTFREISVDDDDDDDDDSVKGDTRAFGRENIGLIASPYILSYLYNRRRRNLDTRYGIRKEVELFKLCNSRVLVGTDSDIMIRGKEFRWTTELWELLTRKSVDRRKITKVDL